MRAGPWLISGMLALCAVGRAGAEPSDPTKPHFLEAGPADGLPVVLLHGARFHAATWQELGTLKRLADAGFHAVAIDIPGPAFDLAAFVAAHKLVKPVVLAPSMGGHFALPFVTGHPDRVSGFVAIAPVELPRYEPALRKLTVPTLIVWGERDAVVPIEQARALHGWVAGSRLVVLQNASHPCYLDRPEEFHAALIEFVRSLAHPRGK